MGGMGKKGLKVRLTQGTMQALYRGEGYMLAATFREWF